MRTNRRREIRLGLIISATGAAMMIAGWAALRSAARRKPAGPLIEKERKPARIQIVDENLSFRLTEQHGMDAVTEASWESFPASDAPSR